MVLFFFSDKILDVIFSSLLLVNDEGKVVQLFPEAVSCLLV